MFIPLSQHAGVYYFITPGLSRFQAHTPLAEAFLLLIYQASLVLRCPVVSYDRVHSLSSPLTQRAEGPLAGMSRSRFLVLLPFGGGDVRR